MSSIIHKTNNHSHRNTRLPGEHPSGDRGQLIFLVIFLTSWILDSFVFRFSLFLGQYIPIYLRLIFAFCLISLALYFVQNGHRVLSEDAIKNPRVFKDGVFARLRHPIYSAALLFYVFLLILTCSLIGLGIFVFIFIFYNFIASYEEKILLEKYGREYQEYMDQVPKWIPRLRPAKF